MEIVMNFICEKLHAFDPLPAIILLKQTVSYNRETASIPYVYIYEKGTKYLLKHKKKSHLGLKKLSNPHHVHGEYDYFIAKVLSN